MRSILEKERAKAYREGLSQASECIHDEIFNNGWIAGNNYSSSNYKFYWIFGVICGMFLMLVLV